MSAKGSLHHDQGRQHARVSLTKDGRKPPHLTEKASPPQHAVLQSQSSPKILSLPAHLRVLRQVWDAPGNQSRRAAALLRAFRWFLVQRRTTPTPTSPSPQQPALLQPVFGCRLYPAYANSIIAKHLMYRSEWFDWDMLHFLSSYLQPGDHFLDIGANTGLHTLLASTRIDPIAGGRLTCLEPHPLNVQRLQHTLQLNALDHATVHPIAASDTNGTLYLTGSDVFAHLSLSNSATTAIPVPTARLDDLLSDTPIHACKIDVEGAEWQVLRGATRLIESGHLPLLILEWRGHLEKFGQTAPDFTAWLQSQNYRLAAYDHATQTLRLSPPYPEDVFAFTPAGLALIQTRLPHLRLR